VGGRVDSVEALGKNLLIRVSSASSAGPTLELRTHLGMHGSWHRYRPGEPWRRSRARARLVLEVEGSVAVCFDARTVELFEARAEPVHPPLARLGPDLLAPDLGETGEAEAVRRLADPSRAARPIAEALLDQTALAGIGNVYKSELLFIERLDPFTPTGEVPAASLARLVSTARRLLLANADRRTSGERRTTGDDPAAGGAALWVYGRAGRPCRRCGERLGSRRHGADLPRVTYWCAGCQRRPSGAGERPAIIARDV
jgi:endonuclease-8